MKRATTVANFFTVLHPCPRRGATNIVADAFWRVRQTVSMVGRPKARP